ncbi:hypothetical protein MASR2M47_28010 [Draconibacterium sp.]
MEQIIAPVLPNSRGKHVANLHEALQLFLAKGIFKVFNPPNRPTKEEFAKLGEIFKTEIKTSLYGKATLELVRFFQLQQQLGDNLGGVVEEKTARIMNSILKELGAFDKPTDPNPTGDNLNKVGGVVINSNGVALAGYIAEVLVVTLEKNISVGKTSSGRNGEYSISYKNPLRDAPDIKVIAYQKGDEKNISSSPTKYNASAFEILNVIVNAGKQRDASEFNKIVNDVQAQLGRVKLSDLKEDANTQQISFLSNKTGWDGRITAMLATAHKLGEQLKIDPSHVYALLRSGVEGTTEALLSVSLSSAETALKSAMGNNIIPTAGNIQETIKNLSAQSVNFVLTNKPFASVSSMDEMLGLQLNQAQKTVFAQTYQQVGNNSAELWSTLQQKGFSKEVISKLQLDGKLGFLTGNNVPLMKKVNEKFKIANELELVSSGLYKPEEWKKLIGPEIPEGLTADEYAKHLANQVELSFPTALVAERLKRSEINLGDNVPKDELVSFITANQSKNIIGKQPIKNWDGFKELSVPAKAAAKTYERLYQITPSNHAMTVLADKQIYSAYQIAKYTKNEFLTAHGDSFADLKQAELTYTKASEVYSASLGIATTYIASRTMPNVYAITGTLERVENETIAYPTLEELFGNMDYCSCEHCKSVLSPAAYFVELMQFIDLNDVPHLKSNPIDVLLERRPDIQHIQLTCENTNKALPYIDLVNEILEYYIINGNLTDLKGHDVTDEITQSELLAEPQFVEESAYDLLKTKVFPYNLPYHQPLEILRNLFQIWDISLEDALGVFSTSLSSRKEALDLNDEEYKTLTDIAFKNLPAYFDQPEGNTLAQLNAAVADGKTFSRTVGISYEDLVVLLKTNFINPGYAIVPLFQKLKINLVDLQQFYEGTITDDQLDALIPVDIVPADYEGDVKQWLRDREQLIMGLITLTDVGSEAAECNFADVELRFALPDNTANRLTAIAYHKFHRFLRILRKTGWGIETLDNLLKVMLPIPSEQITEINIDATFVTVLNRLANFKKLAKLLAYSEKKYANLLLVLDPSLALSLRIEQCAKILKLSIPDLLELAAITGIDFLANDFETDEPSLQKLIVVAKSLKEQSLKVVDLAYILHHVDLNGKLTPTDESLLKNIKLLRSAINTVEAENSIAPDNADFNFAKSKMLQVYDAATTDEFFGLLLNTKTFSAPFITDEESLPAPLLATDANLGFDPFKKELIYTGILSNQNKILLDAAADALVLADMEIIALQPQLNVFIADLKTALNSIETGSNAELLAFATNFPDLKTIYDNVKLQQTPSAQAQTLVNLVMPELKSKLKKNVLQQVLSGVLKSDPDTVNVLTAQKEIIKSAALASEPVLFDFTQLEQKVAFNSNLTYQFYIDVPVSDDYLLYISAPENTVVTLNVDGQTIINNVTVGASKEVKNASPLSLRTGSLILAELTISALPVGETARILWRTKGLAKTTIPDNNIYEANNVSFAKTSLIRLFKASQVQRLFKFTPFELEYFASTNSETKDFLNDLDTDGTISGGDLTALWKKFELLVYFNSLKKENEPEENTWLQVLINPSVLNAQGKLLLESFNLWQETDLTDILAHFTFSRADISKLSDFKKVKSAMDLVTSTGYSALQIIGWTSNNPTYALVANVKDAIKNKATEAVWLETMQSVSDPVRNSLRDALVSYILHYKKPSDKIVNPDKLYEHFLIDVEMDACMKTSRIRQALSTVQLFIQRCLINLEPSVDPSSIRADHWAWMKRYRVWEANRKVFLYPENWLEPELRDNKSSLFKELEGELLQGEVTDESAELAFLNYLKKLDDIAKLEMVGMYLEEDEANNQDDDILHVFGRTNGSTRQYYYRRYEYGYWTPWEKVSLNIEGEHIFPVVWRKRLFVFWLNIFEKPEQVLGTKSAQGMKDDQLNVNAKKNVEISMSWGEYYKGKWTSPKSTDLKRPMIIKNLTWFNSNFLVIYGRKELTENPAGKFRERLIFNINYWGAGGQQKNGVFTFTSKNASPYLEYKFDSKLAQQVINPLYFSFHKPYEGTPEATESNNTQILMPGKNFKVNVEQPAGASTTEITESVLTKKDVLTKGFAILPTFHPVENQFEAPLSYADEHSTFFVKPDEKVFTPIWGFDFYYPIKEAPVLIDIPILVEKPIKDWIPEEILTIDETLITGNPWEKNTELINVNSNYTKVLATSQTFAFGDAMFGAGGKMANAAGNIINK